MWRAGVAFGGGADFLFLCAHRCFASSFLAAFRLAAQRFFIISEMRFRAAGLILRRTGLFAPAVRVAWRPVLSLLNASSAAIARSIRIFSARRSLTSLAVSIFSFPF